MRMAYNSWLDRWIHYHEKSKGGAQGLDCQRCAMSQNEMHVEDVDKQHIHCKGSHTG